jgi:hypothetical protein
MAIDDGLAGLVPGHGVSSPTGMCLACELAFCPRFGQIFHCTAPSRCDATSCAMASVRSLGVVVLAFAALPANVALKDGPAHGAYTLKLHPPVEDAADIKASLDAIMQAERAKAHESDEALVAEKGRILVAEKAELAAIVREAFKPLLEAVAASGHGVGSALQQSSFLESEGDQSTQSAGHVLRLHPPEEDAADVTAGLDAIMKAEGAKARDSDEAFSAEKGRLLAAEKAELAEIVREAFKPLVDALGQGRSAAAGSPRQTSFLSLGVLPIDPQRIRQGLELSQPLRAPRRRP